MEEKPNKSFTEPVQRSGMIFYLNGQEKLSKIVIVLHIWRSIYYNIYILLS